MGLFTLEKTVHSVICTPTTPRYRYRINWFVIYSVTFLNGLSMLIQSPSLHQFITSSSNHSRPDIEPGLNLTETWYSAVVGISSVGTVIGAILFAAIAKRVYFKHGMILELTIALCGSLLYTFGNNGWLILLSRFCLGLFVGCHMPLMRIYILETSEQLIQDLPVEKQAKSTIKYTAMFLMFLHGLSGGLFGPVVVAIAAQIDGLSEFHWPGYYLIAHTFLLLLLVIFAFNERWADITRETANQMKFKDRLLQNLKTPSVPHYLSFIFVICYLAVGWNFSILEVLQNPILSDQFGLDIRSTSYVFVGVASIYVVSVIIMYLLQKFRVDNRQILLLFFISSAIGSVVMIDWQSLGGDPCVAFNLTSEENVYGNVSDASYYCELFGVESGYECFWNPDSRITGDYCERCRQVCLSSRHTLNFIQFIAGMLLLCMGMGPGRLLVTTIASDIADSNSQPTFLMGILVAAGDFSRATGPLWANPLYLLMDHRTWLTMLIVAGLQGTSTILIAVFYRKMKKRRLLAKGQSHVTNGDVAITSEDEIELLRIDNDDEQEQEEKI